MGDGATFDSGDALSPSLSTVNLVHLCGSARFVALNKMEAYYRCRQYDHLRYDWDGRMRGYGQVADISPGWYVPLGQRRPAARYDLALLIVSRFTAMVFGGDRFPQLVVEGDDDAQDYVSELARVARLPSKMQELRNNGGAQGTAVASFGFVDGKPRVNVHNAKHITVLRWADRHEHRPAEVLESYAYPRTVWDVKNGRPKEVTMYFARYWSDQVEITWDPIPDELARGPSWQNAVKRVEIHHGYGFCPVYWVQNKPESDSEDGDSDFEGRCDKFDEINKLLSATNKGTIANVDPTLVIKDDPATANTGTVRKGSAHAIYSKGGAEYLELRGDSLRAALELLKELKQQELDTAGVVLGDPDKMAASVQSAAALRMLYMPMISQADVLRDQYGTFMVQLLTGMLRAAKMIEGQEPGEVFTTADGQRMQNKPTVLLPPRAVETEGGQVMEPRNPGQSENITLNWPPYFPNTWADVKQAIEGVQAARGNSGAIISRRTAVENVAPLLGIADVAAELEAMEDDKAADIAMMQESMGGMDDSQPPGPAAPPGKTTPKEDGE